ncbi:hypothetical protein Tco_1411498, partial [Tanacetum coccineum]
VVKDNMPDLLSDVVKKKRRWTELLKLKAPTDVTDKPYRVENSELVAMFWDDEVAKCNYKEFGDIVSFDATFNNNNDSSEISCDCTGISCDSSVITTSESTTSGKTSSVSDSSSLSDSTTCKSTFFGEVYGGSGEGGCDSGGEDEDDVTKEVMTSARSVNDVEEEDALR